MFENNSNQLDDFLKSKGIPLRGEFVGPPQEVDPLNEFLKIKGYEVLGETGPRPPVVTPVMSQYAEKEFGGRIPGSLTKPPETGEELKVQAETRRVSFPMTPKFWDQVGDVAKAWATGKIDPVMDTGIGDAFIRGLSFGNITQDDVAGLVEKISGKPGFKDFVRASSEEKWRETTGYTPSKVLEVAQVGVGMTGSMAAFLPVLKGAGAVANLLPKIPALQAATRAGVTAIVGGLLQKPEDDNLWNRFKQIPKEALFWGLMEGFNVSAQQFYKIYEWNKSFGKFGPGNVTAKEVKILHRKIANNPTGRAVEPLTPREEKILEVVSDINGWRAGIRGESKLNLPRKPLFSDIFRDLSKMQEVKLPVVTPEKPSGQGPETQPGPTPTPEPTPREPQILPGQPARSLGLARKGPLFEPGATIPPGATTMPPPTQIVQPRALSQQIRISQDPATGDVIIDLPKKAGEVVSGPEVSPHKIRAARMRMLQEKGKPTMAWQEESARELQDTSALIGRKSTKEEVDVSDTAWETFYKDRGWPTEAPKEEAVALAPEQKIKEPLPTAPEKAEPIREEVAEPMEGEAELFKKAPKPKSLKLPANPLFDFVIKKGGISLKSIKDVGFMGEADDILKKRGYYRSALKSSGGKGVGGMAWMAKESGHIKTDDPEDLLMALREEISGNPQYSTEQIKIVETQPPPEREWSEEELAQEEELAKERAKKKPVAVEEPKGVYKFTDKEKTEMWDTVRAIVRHGRDEAEIKDNQQSVYVYALEHFDPRRGAKLSTYVRNIKRFFSGGELTREAELTKAEKAVGIKGKPRFEQMPEEHGIGGETREVQIKEEDALHAQQRPRTPEEELMEKERAGASATARASSESRAIDVMRKAAGGDETLYGIIEKRATGGMSYKDIKEDLKLDLTEEQIKDKYNNAVKRMRKDPNAEDLRKMIGRKFAERSTLRGGLPITSAQAERMQEFIKKWFSSYKGQIKEIDVLNDRRIGDALSKIFQSTVQSATIRKYLNKYAGIGADDFIVDIIEGKYPVDAIAGDTKEIRDLRAAVQGERDLVDEISKQIIMFGDLPEKTEKLFEDNLGKYRGKFYKLHQFRNWRPKKEAIDAFFHQVRGMSEFKDFTDVELYKYIDGILFKERRGVFQKGFQASKKMAPDHFYKRIKMEPSFRNLIGEINDPAYILLKTVMDNAWVASNAKFMSQIHDVYPDLFTTDHAEAMKKGWQNSELPTGRGYGKLKGAYCDPELRHYIMNEFVPQTEAVRKWLEQFILNPFKASKTIFSVPTWARNVGGNALGLSFLAHCSPLNPMNLPYFHRAIKVHRERTGSMMGEWQKLTKVGATETQYWGSEIPKFMDEILKAPPENWPEIIAKALLKIPKGATGRLADFYNAQDSVFRVAAYYKLTEHYGLSPEAAIYELNLGLPNYRKLPNVVNVLRRYPIIGPFISFQWNMGKILANTFREGAGRLKYGIRKAGADSPKGPQKGTPFGGGAGLPPGYTWKYMNGRGPKMLMWGLFILSIPTIISEISKNVFHVSDKDVQDLEKWYPSWRRNSTIVYWRDKNGKLKGFDPLYIWPWSFVNKTITAARKGDWESVSDSLNLFTSPFYSAYSILAEGRIRTAYGSREVEGGVGGRFLEIVKDIYLPASAPIPDLEGLLKGKIRGGKLTPPQIKSLLDAWENKQRAKTGEPLKAGRFQEPREFTPELVAFLTGIRTWTVNPEYILKNKLLELRGKSSDLNSKVRRTAMNSMLDKDEKDSKIEKYRKEQERLAKQVQEIMDLYEVLGKGEFKLEEK